MRRRLGLVLLFLAAANLAVGATITVRQDGTGDYVALQPAFDALAEGDTVLVGPGEYTEYSLVPTPGGGGGFRSYGKIEVRELTIIGSGMGVTVIGPVQYEWIETQNPQGLSLYASDYDLRISDLTVRNCYSGIYVGGTVTMERCELRNCDNGIYLTNVGAGTSIRNSHFAGGDLWAPHGIRTIEGGAPLLVEDCEFVNGYPYVANAETTFRRCTMTHGVLGLEVADGARCQLWGCEVEDVMYGVRTLLGLPGSICNIHDSRIAGTTAALLIDHRTSATAEDCVLTGGSDAVVMARDSEALIIHDCDFVRGAGPVIRCRRPAALGAVTYDLTGNYWGTTDEAEIQSWIIDSNDDASICATVQYSPFAGQSVPTESMTWGDVKALYR